jgi:hypothetical protein
MADIETARTDERCVAQDHSRLSAVVENLPYAVMILLGASVIGVALRPSLLTWIAAAAYVAYGMLGSLWIILFLCPHCPSFGERSCPCGYGTIAARLRPRGDARLFAAKFTQHIPVIVPLWLIPLVVGAVPMLNAFSWPLAILLGLFVLDAFLILPALSKGHGCKECPQREACPWMPG